MNSILRLLCVLMLVSPLAHAQHIFKAKIQPGKSYVTKMTVDGDMNMNFEGDDETIQQLKASGMELPMKILSSQESIMTNKIGQQTIDGKLPFVIEYVDSKSTQTIGGKPVPAKDNATAGMKIYGYIDDTGKAHADSVTGQNGQAQFTEMMDKLLEQIQVRTEFPQRPLKIGDEFTDERPVEMPVSGGTALKMIIKTKYKLTKVDGNEATFDLVQDLTMDLKMDQGDVSMTGSGPGVMKYNMKDQYATSFDATIPLKMKLKVQSLYMTMDGTTKTKLDIVMQ